MSLPWRNLVRGDRRAPAAPDIDDDEEEQPHDVDEVPIPRRGFETEMLLRGEMALIGPHEADDQEDRADQNVKAVEARRHIEGRAVVALPETERRVHIFIGLDRRDDRAEADRTPPAFFQDRKNGV